jgi:hypothetical protein
MLYTVMYRMVKGNSQKCVAELETICTEYI